jgi:signal transduction histidine kinase
MTAEQDVPGTMTTDEAVDRLKALPLLESVPREEIAWLLERGELRSYATGDLVRRAGTAIDEMNLVLTGRLAVYVRRGGDWRRVIEAETGYVAGVVPYSRMQTAPGNLIVEVDTTLLALNQKHFPDLVSECPQTTAALVHQMLDRAREFRTIQMHDERLLALGKLASGLAHELNNPASGASSGARSLASLLDEAERASRALAGARLTDAQLEAIDAVRLECVRTGPERSALEAADREDEFTEWLERHGVDPMVALVLACSDVTLAQLDALAGALPAAALGTAIRWVASGAAARDVAREIQLATARIHDLVHAVKGFTFMDREGVPEEVDIARGLADTLAMLESGSRAKSVDLRVETADRLPRVYGYGSELNQVWEQLIDNAIAAVQREGSVTITATARTDSIVVRVADDGPGIPEENRSRVFDPFFTTKPVGSGTGLGLYQARRIVHRHHGDIDLTSKPGRTVFRVRLPVTGAMSVQAEPAGEAE